MKGIREMALGSDTEEKQSTLFPKTYNRKPYSYDDDLEYSYGKSYSSRISDNSYRSYKDTSPRTDTYTITLQISLLQLGNIADDSLDEYDYDKASVKAEQIAYDRLEALLGKNYESKYSISFETTEGWTTWEIAVTLTPNN